MNRKTVNLYSNKQRWKIFLLIAALVIVGITLWYSNAIAEKIRQEEQLKVQLWSEAIQQRAELVNYTQDLFESLRQEERDKADRLAQAYGLINDPPPDMDLTFVTEYLWSNKTIPVLIYDSNDSILYAINLPPGKQGNQAYTDSLRAEMLKRNEPILLKDVGHTIVYNESYRFSELKSVMQDLINSFISETVINSASVPVVLTDSSQTQVLRAERIDSLTLEDPKALQKKLASMADQNEPIAIDLPESGLNYIFYEESLVIRQLRFFPVVQLVLIAVFLFTSYLIFSTFRKAEQNQVWVGMAKETAHQLGTPMSSLMAWMALLEAQGVDAATIAEMNKDVDRLNTITDRFSKIGSKPEPTSEDLGELVEKSFDYLKTRISRKVEFTIEKQVDHYPVKVSVPLFSWVLENLVKNAVDAMEGVGSLKAEIGEDATMIYVDITDTGKGLPKGQFKTVFQPGFTTKKRGWGLGLSLTKRIVEEYHDGKIFVKRSEIGKGTTFRIMLKREG
ncbi:sensor histidine kinase [Sanyastnella coralliicola]|uniref:sensor histidine kinase n=1 Tax=Sanyastnella coralliicola TaxID=3069118 RepID=UPI0027B8FB22|nr:ATP-binding protein [Longitalea sp. SCSIO 12813]